MSSSITCCSTQEELVPVRLDGFQSCYGSSVHGFTAEPVAGRAATTRRKREFTPEEQKDHTYWLKRSRNNESAKRSRLRRRMEECLLEARAVELLRENEKLKAALSAIHYHNFGVKTHFDGMGGRPVGQGLSRDTSLTPLSDFSAPLAGSDSRSLYALAGGGQVHRLGPSYDPGMENMATPNVLTANVMDPFHQRDRSVGCRLGIPACGVGSCPSSMCVPAAYEMRQREGVQSHAGPNMNSYPGPLSLGDMVVPHDPRLANTEPGCGGAPHIQVHEPCVESGGLVLTQTKEIGKEMKTGKEAERSSVMPLLPHKLRYKVSKAWRDGN